MKKIGNVEIPREAFYKFSQRLNNIYGFYIYIGSSNDFYRHI